MMARERCLNLRQIEVFRAVMLTGSVTQAARTLRISQPAVSRLLRYTEDRLKVALFSRVKGRIYPTAQARLLYAQVEKVFRTLSSVQDVAQTLAAGLVDQLRIVVTPGLATGLLVKSIASLCRQCEHIQVGFEVLSQADLIRQLVTCQADLALSTAPADHAAISELPVAEAGLVCVVPERHKLARLDLVRPADLRGCKLIRCDDGRPSAIAAGVAGDEPAMPEEATIRVASGSLACMLAQQGAGVALVDEFATKCDLRKGIVAIPFMSRTRVRIGLLHNRARPLSELASIYHKTVERLANSASPRPAAAEIFHNVAL